MTHPVTGLSARLHAALRDAGFDRVTYAFDKDTRIAMTHWARRRTAVLLHVDVDAGTFTARRSANGHHVTVTDEAGFGAVTR